MSPSIQRSQLRSGRPLPFSVCPTLQLWEYSTIMFNSYQGRYDVYRNSEHGRQYWTLSRTLRQADVIVLAIDAVPYHAP